MAQVAFLFKGEKSLVQCNIEETMKEICQRYATKINEDVSKLCFLYSGQTMDGNLTFQQQANDVDKKSQLMNVIVIDDDNQSDDIKVNSKEIICPECNENIFINIMDYKINLINCQKGHNINNISFEDFQNTQKINISKIICDSCKETNKGLTHNNVFFKCNTCSQNICPLCKNQKHKTHITIDYSLKDYKCKEHMLDYSKYCNKCKKDFCMKCTNEHKNHDCISFEELIPNDSSLVIDDLRKKIDKFKDNIKDIIKIFENVQNHMEKYYNIILEYINNAKNYNYHVLKNLNEFIRYKNIIINDLNQIINTDNMNSKFNYIMNIYNRINSKNNNTDNNTNSEGPKMNIIFTDSLGITRNLILNHGTTIDQALKKYLDVIDKPELKNSFKFDFIFDMNSLEFGNNTPIEKYFNCMNPRITVYEY